VQVQGSYGRPSTADEIARLRHIANDTPCRTRTRTAQQPQGKITDTQTWATLLYTRLENRQLQVVACT